MTKAELANSLRQRMRARMKSDRQFRHDLESNGIVPEIVLSAMEKQSDDDIINDWLTEIDTEVAEG